MRKFTCQFSDFDISGLRAFFVYIVMLVKHFMICSLQKGKVSCIHCKLFIILIYIHYIIEEYALKVPRRKIRILFKCEVYQLYVEFVFIYLPKDDNSRVLIDCSVWPYLHTRRGENVVQCLAALQDWKSYNAKKFLFLTLVCFMLFYSLHNGFGTVVIFSWQSFVSYKILKSNYM